MFKKEYFFVLALIGLSVMYVLLSFLVLITRGKWGRAFHKKLAIGAAIVTFCAILNTGNSASAQVATDPPPTPTPAYGTPPVATPVPDPTDALTPTPTPLYGIVAGNVWLEPAAQTIKAKDNFTTEIFADAGTQKLAAYGLNITYGDPMISVDIDNGSNGVSPGADGFISAVNATEPGLLRISGFDATGTGPGRNLHLLTIFWTAGPEEGTVSINIDVDSLADANTETIGNPWGVGGTVTIIDVTLGDVNSDDAVDIVDALLVSQYYVGLDLTNFVKAAADVDASGQIDIIDALLISQKYVGLIDKFPGEE
ncbi:MAG: hypothetical protein JXJ04_16205 [Spirochaetales bacterium]|nr:hypothetical protein [Spirochaetales bacterium]